MTVYSVREILNDVYDEVNNALRVSGAGGATTFVGLTDTPSGYTNANALISTNGTPDALIETTVILTEGANTYNITKGTAVLDINASTVNIDSNLSVTATCVLDQDLQQSSSPTFNAVTVTSITDGSATMTGGALSGVTTIGMSGALSIGGNIIGTGVDMTVIGGDGAGEDLTLMATTATSRNEIVINGGGTIDFSVNNNTGLRFYEAGGLWSLLKSNNGSYMYFSGTTVTNMNMRFDSLTSGKGLFIHGDADVLTSGMLFSVVMDIGGTDRNILSLIHDSGEGKIRIGDLNSTDYGYLFHDGSGLVVNASDSVVVSAPTVDFEKEDGTALYWKEYVIPLGASDPGASGPTFIPPNGSTAGGWKLDNAGEILYGFIHIDEDWVGATDLQFHVCFETNIDNGGGDVGDTVDLKAVFTYKGNGESAVKTQTVEVETVVGQAAQFTQFEVEFTVDWDLASNVIEAGDVIAIALNLETDTSEVDDNIVTFMEFKYKTKKAHEEVS